MHKTYKFRIKDSTHKAMLTRKASSVNFIWNYCNEISQKSALRRSGNKLRQWVSFYDLSKLIKGASRELELNTGTIAEICKVFIAKRNKAKRPKLRWRNSKSLGWIPMRGTIVQVKGDTVTYLGRKMRFWKSREIEGRIVYGSFNQDSQGHWYVNIVCEVAELPKTQAAKAIGIDLGLKDLAVCSDGQVVQNNRTTAKYAGQLAKAQRARKKKRVTKIYAKIKNVRKDFLHKESTKLVRANKQIFIGDVSSSKLVKTKMAKSVLDAGWGDFKTMLAYKAIRLGVDFQIVDEKYSTVTCSTCNERSGPSGLGALGVRDWKCSGCGSQHLRDVNAATNILNFGLRHQTPKGESIYV